MEFKKALPILDRFISWASPKRIVMLASVALVLIGSLTIFEKRNMIVSGLTTGDQTEVTAPREYKLELSRELQNEIIDLVHRSPDISLITVYTTNLRINQRDSVFYYTSDAALDLIMRRQLERHGPSQAIFTASEKSNSQIVSVLNGEFACQKFKDTSAAARMPEAVPNMPYFCLVSMPPYYGEFSGYISFGLRRIPTPIELGDLKLEAVKLSTDIYFKAIAKNRRHQS